MKKSAARSRSRMISIHQERYINQKVLRK